VGSLIDIPAELEAVQGELMTTLSRVQARVAGVLESDIPPVQRLVRHVERYHGKMIRPALAALAGLAVGGKISDQHITVGAVCEMVHLATLVHDDVLDEADTRRKADTVNRLHGNEAAVILGDYLFSAAFNLCASLGDQRTSQEIATCGMTLCAGELLQLHHRGNFSLDERTYYTIVERKTASLIAAACRLGARFAGGDGDTQQRFETFGMRLGVAFQIQDDLLDITGDQSVVGKSLGKDLEKGKLTLPLIHHLASATPSQRGRTLLLLEGAEEHPGSRSGELIAALEQTGSVAHARTTAERLVGEARSALAPIPECPAKQMLMLMADAVVTRAF
jgi:octaprenyl-diphosphate synthase